MNHSQNKEILLPILEFIHVRISSNEYLLEVTPKPKSMILS